MKKINTQCHVGTMIFGISAIRKKSLKIGTSSNLVQQKDQEKFVYISNLFVIID